jgi:hypothetical protein
MSKIVSYYSFWTKSLDFVNRSKAAIMFQTLILFLAFSLIYANSINVLSNTLDPTGGGSGVIGGAILANANKYNVSLEAITICFRNGIGKFTFC